MFKLKKMKIKIGHTVETIDDAIKGIVTKVKGNVIFVEGEDGFEFQFSENELINLSDNESVNLGSLANRSIEEIAKEKEEVKKRLESKVLS